MNYQEAKKIMGRNFIGPDELTSIAAEMNITPVKSIPKISYDEKTLKKYSKDYILVLGVEKNKHGQSLTLNSLRNFCGVDPVVQEPCMYNQDWYLKEKFASATTLKNKWYLIRKNVVKESRGVRPDILEGKLKKGERFPQAILTAFTFFAFYHLHNGAMLWKSDLIWCNDKDKNGDRIYTGRYSDPKKVNKNGFNIHRHLSIRPSYGATIVID